jgi:hypothetical protein
VLSKNLNVDGGSQHVEFQHSGPHPAIVLLAARPYQKRTKWGQKYPFFRLLTLSNVFRIKGRQASGHRVKMALYR